MAERRGEVVHRLIERCCKDEGGEGGGEVINRLIERVAERDLGERGGGGRQVGRKRIRNRSW